MEDNLSQLNYSLLVHYRWFETNMKRQIPMIRIPINETQYFQYLYVLDYCFGHINIQSHILNGWKCYKLL